MSDKEQDQRISLSLADMRRYLAKSISSGQNTNKLNGLLAEVEFRKHLESLGFGERVSPGGWIVRSTGEGKFAHHTSVFFPETIEPDVDYAVGKRNPEPPLKLHTICSTFHQLGISSYYCTAALCEVEGLKNVTWQAVQLGLPSEQQFRPFPESLKGFTQRDRNYNFLRYATDVSGVPDDAVAEEFSKENARVAFQNNYLSEMSDVDGIVWGEAFTYPVEIKEKTVATDKKLGEFFGIDVGPFVKLAFYAAKKGNLHSLFVVREIGDVNTRSLVAWWAITFDRLAQYASWLPMGGGTSMTGGRSSVVKVPKSEFRCLDEQFLKSL